MFNLIKPRTYVNISNISMRKIRFLSKTKKCAEILHTFFSSCKFIKIVLNVKIKNI